MRRLRVSAISFLNTAPLMWDFSHGRPPAATGEAFSSSDFDIIYTTPSRCARELASGAADIGIIPAISYATLPELTILPDAAIAAKGPVRSILLVSPKPLEQIATVAADSSSRSSVMLAEVLFRKFLGGARTFTQMDPSLNSMLGQCDAALLIGDPALRIPLQGSGYRIYDLAELWLRYTGHPFVFAFWAIRTAALAEARPGLNVAQVFRDSRDRGLEPASLERIVPAWAPAVGISESQARTYLTKHIHFFLDQDCLRGLDLFYRHAAGCGLIPRVPELRFFGASTSRDSTATIAPLAER